MADETKVTLEAMQEQHPELVDQVNAIVKREIAKEAKRQRAQAEDATGRLATLQDELDAATAKATDFERKFSKAEKAHKETSERLTASESARNKDAARRFAASKLGPDGLNLLPKMQLAVLDALTKGEGKVVSVEYDDAGEVKTVLFGGQTFENAVKDYTDQTVTVSTAVPGNGTKPGAAQPTNTNQTVTPALIEQLRASGQLAERMKDPAFRDAALAAIRPPKP